MQSLWMRFFAAALVLLVAVQPAAAQSLLRDAETEREIRRMITPILLAAELEPDAVSLFLISDQSTNAFVAGGQNIFMHSGLILNATNVNQVLGVLAHEAGHISGGHIVRFQDGARGASAISIISMLLGAAAIAAGSPDAGIAIFGGGQQAALRNFLAYSRVQEASADQAGAQFLDAAGISGEGLIEFFEALQDQEFLLAVNQDPYVRSHPLTTDRIVRLRERVQASPHYGKPPSPENEHAFQRIKAKLAGYVYHPRITLQLYPESDTSLYARYARVYAYDKALEWDKALGEAESLIAEFPDDPYFREIAGQILYENGRIEESLPHLKRAKELAPREPLILTAYGQALAALETEETDAEALAVLELAAALDPYNDSAWYHLATIYSRHENEPLASLAAAERMALYGRHGQAAFHAKKAVDTLPVGSPKHLRAQDILLIAQSNIEETRGQRGRGRNR